MGLVFGAVKAIFMAAIFTGAAPLSTASAQADVQISSAYVFKSGSHAQECFQQALRICNAEYGDCKSHENETVYVDLRGGRAESTIYCDFSGDITVAVIASAYSASGDRDEDSRLATWLDASHARVYEAMLAWVRS